ncbi:hypothetical protein H4I95_10589 [Botrytis cinerea]
MVLENSSSKEANGSFDSVPTSDSDPYASSERGQGQAAGIQTYRIDGSKLPRPLPLFGPLFGFNDAFLTKIINARIQNTSKITQRPLRQEEIDALAFHTAKILRINSFAPVAGLSAGIYRAVQTAPTFRFPFYQPNLEVFNSSVFPHAKMPYIKGPPALIAWHAFRGLCYAYIGTTVSKLLFGGDSQTPMKPGQGQPQPQTRNTQGYDDASPTGDAQWSEEDNAPGSAQTTPQAFPQTKSWPPRKPVPAQAPAQEEEKPFDLFDDASPTNGQGMDTEPTTPQYSRQTGSAWDRIRRGEKPTSNSTTTSSQPPRSGWATVQNKTPKASSDGTSSADSFAFSKTEEERNLAQVEAQKEFDARVEKERRGGDFSSGGDQKRW